MMSATYGRLAAVTGLSSVCTTLESLSVNTSSSLLELSGARGKTLCTQSMEAEEGDGPDATPDGLGRGDRRDLPNYIDYLRSLAPGNGAISIHEPGSVFLEEFIMDLDLFSALSARLNAHCHICSPEVTKNCDKSGKTTTQQAQGMIDRGEGLPEDWLLTTKNGKNRFKKGTEKKAAGGGLWICQMEDCAQPRLDPHLPRQREGFGGIHRVYCRRCVVQRLGIDFPTLFDRISPDAWRQKTGPGYNLCLHCNGYAGQPGKSCIGRKCVAEPAPRRTREGEAATGQRRAVRHRGLPREDGPPDRVRGPPRPPPPPPPPRTTREEEGLSDDEIPSYGGDPVRCKTERTVSCDICFLSPLFPVFFAFCHLSFLSYLSPLMSCLSLLRLVQSRDRGKLGVLHTQDVQHELGLQTPSPSSMKPCWTLQIRGGLGGPSR